MEALMSGPGTKLSLGSRAATMKPAVRGRIPLDEINELNGFTPRVQRLKQRYLEARSAIDGERARWLLESMRQTEGEHPAKRRAKAFAHVLARMTIGIRDDELLVGAMTGSCAGRCRPWRPTPRR